jgi:hypothetical protein
MPNIIVKDKIKYSLITYDNEKHLEDIVFENGDFIFGDKGFLIRTQKKLGKNSYQGSIPDGYYVDLTFHEKPKLYFIEIELSAHDAINHIANQMIRFNLADDNSKIKIKSIITDEIKKSPVFLKRVKDFLEKNKKIDNLEHLVDYIVLDNKLEVIIVVDEMEDKLANQVKPLLNKMDIKINILEFKTFKSGSNYIYNFDAFQEEIIESAKFLNNMDEIDTVVVAAKEEGFNDVFIGQNMWYAIRISEEIRKKLKYIAVYQKTPVKAITYYAEIDEIKPYNQTDKYLLKFKGKAKKLDKELTLGPGDNSGFMQAHRYTTLKKLLSVNFATDIWKK